MVSSRAVEEGPPQADPDALPRGGWDVAVAGAGPAGATAALHLAARGRRVLLLDRQRFPREKVCGDGLIRDALGALDRSGLLESVRGAAHAVRRVTLYSPGRVKVTLDGEFLTLRRERLDAILARGAVDRGAVFARGTVRAIEPGGAGVEVFLENRPDPVAARVAIVATGADVALPAALRMTTRRAPSAIAMRCYVRSEHRIDDLVVSFDHSVLPGYAWIFPLGRDEYNVGVGVFPIEGEPKANLRTIFDALVREFPVARALFEKASSQTPLRGAPLRSGLHGARAIGPAGVVGIGEVVGSTFDFTGEGIGKAMETGELAAEVLDAALSHGAVTMLQSYAGDLTRRLAPKYGGYEIAARWMSHPWVADLVFRRARSSPWLREMAAGILAETVDPAEVFNLRGLLGSFLR